METQLISKNIIKPSLPTPSHLINMPLAFTDLFFPSLITPSIYFYKENNPLQDSTLTIQRLNLLKKSLSDILTLFYPIAGRYDNKNGRIRCNDEGVEYYEANVNIELCCVLEGQLKINELECLLPDNYLHMVSESETSPLMSIQINVFKCGGLGIAMRVSHRLVDGFTASLFVNGWAKACKLGHVRECTVPNFEGGVLFPCVDKSKMCIIPDVPIESELVVERFLLQPPPNQRFTTTFIIAAIWRAQIKAAKARHGVGKSSLLSVAVSLRGRTNMIPENCCGNFFMDGIARFEVEDHEKEMSLDVFEEKVRDAIKSVTMELSRGKEDEEGFLSELVMRSTREIADYIGKGDGYVSFISSLRNFSYYEVDFGWGNPSWLNVAHRTFKSVTIMDTKNKDGVEVWVTMDAEEMEYFRNDSDILSMLVTNRFI